MTLNNYNDFLPQLKSTTLFQDISDEDILALLDVLQPTLIHVNKGELMPEMPAHHFRMFLSTTPAQPIVPRAFKYDMPKFGEPGMLMHEIPTLSRMGETLEKRANGPKRPFHKPHPLAYDADILEFSENAMTTFYNSAVAPAQGQLLRNFLGILAQKVNDVRHELFLIRDCRDMFQERDKTLQIFTAGVAMKVVTATAQRWNLAHPERQAEVHTGGSIDLVRRILAGERCDVLVTADDTTIAQMLMPDHATGYITFASNKMVVSASNGAHISSANWKEKLTAPDATFYHKNPYGDPGGYRGVMALLLANAVEPGLGDRLMAHPGHIGMDPALTPATAPAHQYTIEYYSAAASRGAEFAELPDEMNLSNPALAATYATATFAVDENNTVAGAPITHGITIPTTAIFKDEAKAFVESFLANDFAAYHFLPAHAVHGDDILK